MKYIYLGGENLMDGGPLLCTDDDDIYKLNKNGGILFIKLKY